MIRSRRQSKELREKKKQKKSTPAKKSMSRAAIAQKVRKHAVKGTVAKGIRDIPATLGDIVTSCNGGFELWRGHEFVVDNNGIAVKQGIPYRDAYDRSPVFLHKIMYDSNKYILSGSAGQELMVINPITLDAPRMPDDYELRWRRL